MGPLSLAVLNIVEGKAPGTYSPKAIMKLESELAGASIDKQYPSIWKCQEMARVEAALNNGRTLNKHLIRGRTLDQQDASFCAFSGQPEDPLHFHRNSRTAPGPYFPLLLTSERFFDLQSVLKRLQMLK